MVVDHDRFTVIDQPLRLLIIEPADSYISSRIRGMLTSGLPSVEIEVAYNTADGLVAMEGAPDIVIIDLLLSDIDGASFVAKIHRSCNGAALLVLNGPVDRSLALNIISVGADDYLAKDSYDASSLTDSVLYAVERKRAQILEESHQLVVNDLVEAIEGAACSVNSEGVIVAVNKAWKTFTAATDDDMNACGVGADYLSMCGGLIGEPASASSQIAKGLRAILAGTEIRFELNYRHPTLTSQQWFNVQISQQPDGTGAVIIHRDTTAITSADSTLERQLLYDDLTELPNRILLRDRLEQALAEGRRSGRLVAATFLDIDHFHNVNVRFGRDGGDVVLAEAARRLARCIRDGDTLSRLDGDQFVVIWRDLAIADEAHHLSSRLAKALEAPFILAKTKVALTASIGIGIDRWAQTADELMLTANAAMREAKRSGTGLVRVFKPELYDDAAAAINHTTVSLRDAMYRNELVLHYQPLVDLTHGTVVGVEALVRWQHPTDGLLGPDLFIPVAEASGQIVALGAWVIEKACTQAMQWKSQGLHLEMAVNLSARQVNHPDLIETLSRVLRNTGIEPGRLVLEVTESAIIEDAEAAAAVLTQISSLGVSLAIDDFGTGYSSFVYLKRYPIRALKIDRSFIAGMGIMVEDDAIIASVIKLAKAVGGSCIAEGVETHEQFVSLHKLGCDFAQGWLFGQAVPAEEIPDLVAQCEVDLATRLLTLPPPEPPSDTVANDRDQVANDRDQVANDRDQVANERDQVANERDIEGNRRDTVADRRDSDRDHRDTVADERDIEGDHRDTVADERDIEGDHRDTVADERESDRDHRDTVADERVTAQADRETQTGKRNQAELERDTAQADREIQTGKRNQAEFERDTVQAASKHARNPDKTDA